MATVTGTSTNTNSLYGTAASSAADTNQQSSSSSSAAGSASLANESTFLTLLVAQMKNQDPTQPADGMQFVTQLAQFSSLEQNLAMRQDLDSINTKLTTATPASSVKATQQ